MQLTLAALETIVEFACEMCEQQLGVHGPVGSVVATETYHDCGVFVCGIREVVGLGVKKGVTCRQGRPYGGVIR